MRPADVEVLNNNEQRQFEIHDGDQLAHLRYARHGDVLELIHTEVPPSLEGRGYGSKLAVTALDYAAEHSLLVKPTCPFVRTYLERHPEYSKLTTRTDD